MNMRVALLLELFASAGAIGEKLIAGWCAATAVELLEQLAGPQAELLNKTKIILDK